MDTDKPNALYLGIDGGGSRCRAKICDQSGQLLGSGESGPANLRLGTTQVKKQVIACTQDALRQAGLADVELKQLRAGLGLAGAVLDEDVANASALQSLFATCNINTDAYIACLGAHLGKDGAIVIVGTGSCAQVIHNGVSRSFGGWGFEISDQASGAWLGRRAVRSTVLALDGLQRPSALSHEVAKNFSQLPSEILRWSQTAKPADYANFAPLVFACAEAGDAQASALVQDGCLQLTLLIRAVEEYSTGRISLLGGLAEPYWRHLPETITALLCIKNGDALDGALLTAGLPARSLEHL